MLKRIFPSLAMANIALPDEIYALVDVGTKRGPAPGIAIGGASVFKACDRSAHRTWFQEDRWNCTRGKELPPVAARSRRSHFRPERPRNDHRILCLRADPCRNGCSEFWTHPLQPGSSW